MEAEVEVESGLSHPLREPQVRRGVVDRVAAHDDQEIDQSPVQVVRQLGQRRGVVDRPRRQRGRVEDGLADDAEVVVNGMGKQVNGGRLAVSGHDNHGPGGRADRKSLATRRIHFAASAGRSPAAGAALPLNSAARARANASMSPAQGKPVIGLGARVGQRRLDHVQPVHVRLAGVVIVRPQPPTRHELGDVADAAGAPQPRQSASGDSTTSAVRTLVEVVKAIVGVKGFAVGRRGGAVGGVAGQRLVLMPFFLGKLLENAFDLVAERRRHDRFGQQAQPGPRRGRCLSRAPRRAARASSQVAVSPRRVTLWERSGSYSVSTEA